MSKQVKQMQMDALAAEVKGVRDLVVLSVSGRSAGADNRLRLDLRKKGIRRRTVRNSLLRRVPAPAAAACVGSVNHLAAPRRRVFPEPAITQSAARFSSAAP